MDTLKVLISNVEQRVKQANSSQRDHLQTTLQHLKLYQQALLDRSTTAMGLLEDIREDFKRLESSKLLEGQEENGKLLDQLEATMRGSMPHHTNDSSTAASSSQVPSQQFSLVEPPKPMTIPPGVPLFPVGGIPSQLAEVAIQVSFLHLLATDPSKVLPPGKSLLSVFSRSSARPPESKEDSLPTLHEKIESIAHRAFWDEALESLLDPQPSTQLRRIKAFYNDIRATISPLLPSEHPVLLTLSAPLSPTPSPLRSALLHIREVVTALRVRCAPVRDSLLDALLRSLDDPSPDFAEAKLIVDTVKAIFGIAEAMKDDLSQFVLGAMSEKQLSSIIQQQAKAEERALVQQLWSSKQIKQSWRAWLRALDPPPVDTIAPQNKWILRLFQALRSSNPISSAISDSAHDPATPKPAAENALPPPFLFSVNSLLYLQNYLQALVIAATLRSLTPLPPPAPKSSSDANKPHDPGADFMERVWTLLLAEVDEEEGSGGTKLINLADEVVRARRGAVAAPPLDADGEARLRAAVDRTLQPKDPVFLLLQQRLMSALATRLQRDDAVLVPERMQTGRDGERAEKRLRLALNTDGVLPERKERAEGEQALVIKGFEHPIVAKGILEALGKLRTNVDWIANVWEDVILSTDDDT